MQTIGGNANFGDSQVQDLGNLQTIGRWADFEYSQVQSLGNLQTIGGNVYFRNSQVQDLGNLQTIGGRVFWGERTDLQAEWEGEEFDENYVKGGGVRKEEYVWASDNISGLKTREIAERKAKELNEEWEYVRNAKVVEVPYSWGTDYRVYYEYQRRKYAEGGGVKIPKNKSLRHFILNEMSAGMIANKVPYSDYATIDKIRIQAVQILNRDGDREYSLQSVSDLIQEALLEYEENKSEMNFANGGEVFVCPVGTEIQTLIFDKSMFNLRQARVS